MEPKVIYGDITKIPCDAIVNSLGTDTVVYGKLCDAIVTANNDPAYAEEIKNINGKAQVLDCFLWKAKNISAPIIINIVTPYASKDYDYQYYFEAYKKIFNTARENKLYNLAIPLIGTGPNGYWHLLAKEVVEKMAKAYSSYYPEMNISIVYFSSTHVRQNPKEKIEEDLDILKNWIMEQKTGRTYKEIVLNMNFTKKFFDSDNELPISMFNNVPRANLLAQTRRDDFHEPIIPPITYYEYPGYYIDKYLEMRYGEDNKADIKQAKANIMTVTTRKILEHLYDRPTKDRLKLILVAIGARMSPEECKNFLESFGFSTNMLNRSELLAHTFINERFYNYKVIKEKLLELKVLK